MNECELRPFSADDKDFLVELYFNVRSAAFFAAGMSEEQIRPLLSIQFATQMQSYATRFPNSEHSIIEVGSINAGRLLIDRNPSEIHLIDISISSDFQGKGIGGSILRRLQTESNAVSLSVFETNLGARRLYERNGFRVLNEEGGYLSMEWRKMEHLSAKDFATAVATKFRIGETEIELELASVNERSISPNQETFSLTFRGTKDQLLSQQTYALHHSALGAGELFLVPVGQDSDAYIYEATFNRLIR